MALNSALLDQVDTVCRRKGYSRNTAKTYRHWCEQYIRWLRQDDGTWINPADCGRNDIQRQIPVFTPKSVEDVPEFV